MEYPNDFYRSIIENMLNGFAYHKIIVNASGDPVDYMFLEVNTAFETMTGLIREDIIGKRVTEVFPDIIHSEFDWIHVYGNVAIHGTPVHFEQKFESLGKHYFVNAYSPVREFFITIFNDISELKLNQRTLEQKNEEQKLKEETIRQMVYFDGLTNLPNRKLFIERLSIALKDSERNGCKTAVVFIDIDNFKKVNDTLGHFAGDEVLIEVSERLEASVGNRYTLSRFSGDEFTFFIQGVCNMDEVVSTVTRIKQSFQNPFIIRENSLHLTISMGITFYPEDGQNIEELLKNADTAMYKVKEHGKNNFQLYNKSMKEEIIKKVYLEKRLRKAITSHEFELFFQPQVNAKTGKIRGFEALIRWMDPEMGMVSPLEFIPIAEETGLIIPIGNWVLKTACEKKKQWQEVYDSDAIISVNISALQLKQKNFVKVVKSILDETGLEPQFLELEITESILIESFEIVTSMLEELRALGVKIALDDFGTGYSSLNYLKNLPLNSLKIDKTFVQDIKVESVEKAIIGSIISLVHKLELEIIAEGIETREQLDYLILCNCDSIQGYLLSKPVMESEAEEFLRQRYIKLTVENE